MADDLGSRELRALWYRWQEKRNKDVIEAALKKEEDLTDLEIQTNFSWPQVWNAPPFLVPQNATNAETINAILIKSWETQGSSCTGLPRIRSRFGNEANVLFENKGFKIIALLNHYFKNMPMVTVNISRKVGLLQSSGPDPVTVPWSFLQISHLYEIDNSFSVTGMEANSPSNTLAARQKTRILHEDPSTSKRGLSKFKGSAPTENIPLKHLSSVCGPDEKMEQKLVFETCGQFCPRLNLYDINMRKFIALKYGLQIPSLTQKWSKLCWHCFASKEELKKCTKCLVAHYCGKECQRNDWKIHKVLHDELYEDYVRFRSVYICTF